MTAAILRRIWNVKPVRYIFLAVLVCSGIYFWREIMEFWEVIGAGAVVIGAFVLKRIFGKSKQDDGLDKVIDRGVEIDKELKRKEAAASGQIADDDKAIAEAREKEKSVGTGTMTDALGRIEKLRGKP